MNTAPVLDPIGDKTVDEMTLLTFTATATDADIPAQTLTFSLVGALPVEHHCCGVFTWTPSEAQGPGDYTFDVVVSDGLLSIRRHNSPCQRSQHGTGSRPDGDKSVVVDNLLSSLDGTDADIPVQTLTFSLVSAPAGASISAAESLHGPQRTWRLHVRCCRERRSAVGL